MLCSQGKRLVKVFAAERTVIAAFPVMEEGMFAHDRKVFDDGNAIIMDFICQPEAMSRYKLCEGEKSEYEFLY